MSCPNETCNPGCGCVNCCPPPVPPTPPTPPDCEGTDCEELYDGACVNYTGPAITCFGITTNMSLNAIVQTMAQTLCNCAQTGATCLNPLKVLVQRSLAIYQSMINVTPDVITYSALIIDILDAGLIFKKCNYCCPDNVAYGLFFDTDDYGPFLETIETINIQDPVTNPCLNCAEGFTTCSAEFFTNAEVTAYPIIEFGGFNTASGLCALVSEFEGHPAELLAEFITGISDEGLIVACDTEKGDVFIGNNRSYSVYVETLGLAKL